MTSTYTYVSLWLSASLLTAFAACTDSSADHPSPRRGETSGANPPDQATGAAIKLGDSTAQLETTAASRGGVALDLSIVASERTSPGVLTIVRASFVETVATLADATEQSWYFEQAPGHGGDLVVVVSVTGLDHVSTSAEGLLLHRPGLLDVRYSHGVWLESSGTRTPIPAIYSDGRILLTVPARIVDHATYPALLDPKIIVTPVTGARSSYPGATRRGS